jgi:hypothetical protein
MTPKIGIWYKGSNPPVSGAYWVTVLRSPGVVHLYHYRKDRSGWADWFDAQGTVTSWAAAGVPKPPDSIQTLPEWKQPIPHMREAD